MDPTERLAADVQELKKRFDEMSLRFAVSEEREKRVDDKIDNMVSMLTNKIGGLEKSVNGWNTTGRWVLTVFGAVVIGALGRWVISGQLAGF
jgi:hypothetical protein